ncbi:site-2 protease family protein [uncultured Brachybacterium sp.]|uniref:site-2 protease family protein n=1 Tax=uncultured Brachybacterium sp. TaxID=189680 RepID=UPI002617E892|nr:site-2 protease family protein [uncultured Brachybacterium sp.]
MRSPTLRLGALPPLKVSPGTLVTVLLLAVLMYPALSRGGADPGLVVLLAMAIGLFMIVSVLAHEVAHAVTARAFGATVDHIALTLWGGHTQYRVRQMSSLGSVLVSLSGPAANGVLAALMAAATQVAGPGTSLAVFFSVSAWLNLVLALFNLLPGLPMDGGRALESLLAALVKKPVLATRITAWLGRAIAVAVVAYPLVQIVRTGGAGSLSLLTLVWAMLIAGMLWQGATRALEGAVLQSRIHSLAAGSLAVPLRIVPPHTPLAALGTPDQLDQVLLLERDAGLPGGIGRGYRIDPEAAASVPPEHRASTPASAVAGSVGPLGTLPLTLQGDALIEAMLSQPAPAYLVLAEDGTLHGVLLSAEVNDLLRRR